MHRQEKQWTARLYQEEDTHADNAPGGAPPLAQEAQRPQQRSEHCPEGAQHVLDRAQEGEDASDGDGNGQREQDLHEKSRSFKQCFVCCYNSK